jgi:hypothetical protein
VEGARHVGEIFGFLFKSETEGRHLRLDGIVVRIVLRTWASVFLLMVQF